MVRFNEREELHRSSNTEQQPGDNSNNLTLTGICEVNCRSANPNGGGRDNYGYYGETGNDPRDGGRTGAGNGGTDNYGYYGETRNPRSNPRAGDSGGKHCGDGGQQGDRHVDYGNAERSEVTLQKGDTFWKLAGDKYNGHYPIEAIYEANGLHPSVKNVNGHIELQDPTYYAGKTYVLPAASEIPDLISKYHQKVAELGGYSQDRVGNANEATPVKLIYGDTFWKLAQSKYGQSDHPPIEAIYEANGLVPKVEDCNGQVKIKDPTYYAGQTYKLPSAADVPALEREFYQRIGHPELCPAQYRDARDQSAGNPPPQTTDNMPPPNPTGYQGGPWNQGGCDQGNSACDQYGNPIPPGAYTDNGYGQRSYPFYYPQGGSYPPGYQQQADVSANQYAPEVQPWGGAPTAADQMAQNGYGYQNDAASQYMNNQSGNSWEDPNQATG